jgi:hypothetical protein
VQVVTFYDLPIGRVGRRHRAAFLVRGMRMVRM